MTRKWWKRRRGGPGGSGGGGRAAAKTKQLGFCDESTESKLEEARRQAFLRPSLSGGIGSRQQKQRLRAPRRRSRPPSPGGCRRSGRPGRPRPSASPRRSRRDAPSRFWYFGMRSPSPTLLHAFVLGPGLLPPFPSVKPMDATTLSQDHGRDYMFRPSPSFSSPLQSKRLRSIPMPPERAALLDAAPSSEYPPFSILSLLMMFPPQPRGFCRSQSTQRCVALPPIYCSFGQNNCSLSAVPFYARPPSQFLFRCHVIRTMHSRQTHTEKLMSLLGVLQPRQHKATST